MRSSNCFLSVTSLLGWATASISRSTAPLDESNGRWVYDLPPAEAAALAAFVDIEAPDSLHLDRRDGNPSPQYDLVYEVELPIPPVKQPFMTLKNPLTGNPIFYYEVEIKPFTQQIFPHLKPTKLVGYDGMSPGPTFIVPRGTESIVRFINKAETASAVHLHGSYSRAPFDGWAEDLIKVGEYKDYYYPNMQNGRSLWYHDHAIHDTAKNAYAGQAGMYLVTDPSEDALNLPSGYGEYDIPLMLTARQYNADGTLSSLDGEIISLWGDVIEVNGQPWPYLRVEPRKYRFRFLDAAVSRSFALYFVDSANVDTLIPFQIIASDSGLLEKPVEESVLYITNGERYEVVLDFSQFAGKAIELRNYPSAGGITVETDYANTAHVMCFNVSSAGPAVQDTSAVPAALRTVPFPHSATPGTVNHHFGFHREDDGLWTINGHGFSDANNRVLANVPRGTVEIWELVNGRTLGAHPVHVHLVDFRVIQRTGGRGAVMPYEAAGLKDVVWLGKGENALVEAHYAPWDGVYMFHCHNMIHEDRDMMAAFNITALPDLGYNETTNFADPMDARWRAKKFAANELATRSGPFSETSIRAMVDKYAAANPYSDKDKVMKALDDYWGGKQSAVVTKKDEHGAMGPVPRFRRLVV